MMKRLILISIFISSSAFSKSYELINFYKGWIYPVEELLELLPLSAEAKQFFSCSSQGRRDLFNNFIPENPKGDSLKVVSKKGLVYTYKHGELYFNDELVRPKRRMSFLRDFMAAMEKLEATKTGAALIDEIERSSKNFRVKAGKPSFSPQKDGERLYWRLGQAGIAQYFDARQVFLGKYNERGEVVPLERRLPLEDIGSGGVIFWNSQVKIESLESDEKIRITPPEVVLAHELYHAYDSARGLLDKRLVSGTGYQQVEVAEYRASYLENVIRKELGLSYRLLYGQLEVSNDGGTILDSLGEPVNISAPCISWLDSWPKYLSEQLPF